MSAHKKVPLPITGEEFDELVKKLVKRFKLPNEEHASAVVANQIMRLPPDQAETTMEYLGACVLKNIAYQVAQSKGSLIQHKMQIDLIMAELKTNPFNQEALDALEKAANEGSQYAKKMLAEGVALSEPAPILNLVETGKNRKSADHEQTPDSA